MSSLFFLVSAVGFFAAAPLTTFLRNHKLCRRRVIILWGLAIIGAACMIRTGNLQWLTDDNHIAMVYVGQVLNGVGLALMVTTMLPEQVDSIE